MFLANQFLLMLNFMLAIVVDSYGKHSDGLSREGGREGGRDHKVKYTLQ